MNILRQIFSLFDNSERKQIYWLFLGMVVRGMVEVVGVASIMPFIAVVSNPETIQSNQFLQFIYTNLHFQSARSFLLFLGLCVFFVIVINNGLSAITDWYLFRFSWLRAYSISKKLLVHYLAKPYSFFLNVNTAELGANILNEVSQFMKGVLHPFVEMGARLVVCVFIFALLLIIDPLLAIIVGVTLGSAYSMIFIYVRKKLIRIGKERIFHNKKQFIYINESLGGIKDIKVQRCEPFFLNAFSRHAFRVNYNQATHQIVSQIPRYALEVVAFGGILLIILYFVLSNKSTEQTIPLMALYAFAGYRLMPALQKVFIGVTTVKFNSALLAKLHNELALDGKVEDLSKCWTEPVEDVPFTSHVDLQGLDFTYPGSDVQILRNLNLTIKKGTTVGLVGTTGAGKTSMVDLILGLLEPDSGSLLVDGLKLDQENMRGWLANIGYVPQHIFLSDQSIKQNIALGIPEDMIDEEKLLKASKIANLHQFITNELEDGYDTLIGERGVRLSGGQRQRIGIARAMYHDPELLILDEATSSLDNVTEKGVMEAIHRLAGKKTIVIIAHRLTTLEACDVIHFLKQGSILQSGTYEELSEKCDDFKELLNVTGGGNQKQNL